MSRHPVHALAIILLTIICCGCTNQNAPSGVTLTATPTSITPGATATLSWTTIAGATSCSIDNTVGSVACTASSRIVTPAVTTTYTLTATGTGGSSTSTATVTVSSATPTATPTPVGGITPVTPIMGTFTASPTTIRAGGQTTLSWKGIANADHCLIDNNVGLVPCSDSSIVVSPPGATSGDSSVTYTFTAVGILASVSATVHITVTAP